MLLCYEMKTFIIYLAFFLCFSRSLAVLKCYLCNDSDPRYPNCNSESNHHYLCPPEKSKFCATSTIKNQPNSTKYKCAADKEYCMDKGCTDNYYCDWPGTFRHEIMTGVYITVDCCEEDLCNSSFSSAQKFSLNVIFYIVVMSCFCFVNIT